MLTLITGGAGYIASVVALSLLENGYNIVIFDNLENGHREIIDALKKIEAKGKVVDFMEGDLREQSDISAAFSKHKIDIVLHFAAHIQVEESTQNPQKYYINNVCGSMNLLGAMLANSVDKIVFSSTAAIYGEPESVPIDENHRLAPINPYGWSKFIVEKILNDYEAAYGLKSVSLRYFNVAGADRHTRIGEWHEPETHLIPNILAAINNQERIFQIYGDNFNTRDGTCLRDYVNVEDLADAHVFAMQYLLDGGTSDCFNIGTDEGYTVKEVLDACEKITQKKIEKIIVKRRAGDSAMLVADSQKARKILNWKPKRSLEDSISSAYKWYLKAVK
ncbi:MAG: UDP-glucose 4-epimerase GalE [Holosporaceae bacterium]|jgi:UDP-glucose 4-epimerase|nr:UDP-glucose 4-epimerase GalE [Holosporaceae bacterium]